MEEWQCPPPPLPAYLGRLLSPALHRLSRQACGEKRETPLAVPPRAPLHGAPPELAAALGAPRTAAGTGGRVLSLEAEPLSARGGEPLPLATLPRWRRGPLRPVTCSPPLALASCRLNPNVPRTELSCSVTNAPVSPASAAPSGIQVRPWPAGRPVCTEASVQSRATRRRAGAVSLWERRSLSSKR